MISRVDCTLGAIQFAGAIVIIQLVLYLSYELVLSQT